MSCCFVPAFQVKERCERTERKVSTALFLHGDWAFFSGGNNGDLRFDPFSCFALQTNSHSQSSAALPDILFSMISLLCSHSLFLCQSIFSHMDSQNTPQRYYFIKRQATTWDTVMLRLACSSQVINTGNTSSIHPGEWVTLDEVIALFIPVLYTFPPFSISSLHSFHLFFTVYIPLNSRYWLLWYR